MNDCKYFVKFFKHYAVVNQLFHVLGVCGCVREREEGERYFAQHLRPQGLVNELLCFKVPPNNILLK